MPGAQQGSRSAGDARRREMAANGAAALADPADRTSFVPTPAARRLGWLTDARLARLCVTPAGLLLFALFIFPLLWALVLSFTSYSATRNATLSWIGMHNYIEVLTSPSVWQRGATTAILVVSAVGTEAVVGFAIAYLISRRRRGQGLLTILFIVPMVLPQVIVGAFWRFMLDTQFGVVNGILVAFGLGRVDWLTSPPLALLSLVVVDAWQWTPFIMVITLAGLTALPAHLYEAAEIDRASDWYKFRHITLPLVWPLVLIAVLFRAIDAFRLFDTVFVVTGGGPGTTTETLSFQLYKVAFRSFDTGLASAYGVLMAVVVIIGGSFYVRYLRKVQAR